MDGESKSRRKEDDVSPGRSEDAFCGMDVFGRISWFLRMILELGCQWVGQPYWGPSAGIIGLLKWIEER